MEGEGDYKEEGISKLKKKKKKKKKEKTALAHTFITLGIRHIKK